MTAQKPGMDAGWKRIKAHAGRVFAVNLGLAVMLIGMASVVVWLARGDTGALLAPGVGRFFIAGGAIALAAAIVAGGSLVRTRFARWPLVGLTGVQSAVAFVFWWANGPGWTVPLIALCAHCYTAYELLRVARLRPDPEGPEVPEVPDPQGPQQGPQGPDPE